MIIWLQFNLSDQLKWLRPCSIDCSVAVINWSWKLKYPSPTTRTNEDCRTQTGIRTHNHVVDPIGAGARRCYTDLARVNWKQGEANECNSNYSADVSGSHFWWWIALLFFATDLKSREKSRFSWSCHHYSPSKHDYRGGYVGSSCRVASKAIEPIVVVDPGGGFRGVIPSKQGY